MFSSQFITSSTYKTVLLVLVGLVQISFPSPSIAAGLIDSTMLILLLRSPPPQSLTE